MGETPGGNGVDGEADPIGPIVHPTAPTAPRAGRAPVRSVVHTACPYCGVGCGLLARPDGRGGATIAGDPAHPANHGKLCSKGAALGETLGLGTRLLHPMMRQGAGPLRRVSWDDALGRVAEGFRTAIERHGPDSVSFYLSGQLLTEDYYAANKLAKGFLGTANVDTNSRLCMASTVSGHRRAFGSDTVPGVYADLDLADLVVLVGSNAAWCHPVLFRRLEAARAARGTRLVVIDPRHTATASEADLALHLNPGKDTIIFAGLLAFLAEAGRLDTAYIAAHTSGFEAALARARALAPDIDAAARASGVPAADLAAFYRLFAETERVVTAFSQGVNQSAQGTDKVNAIINCHLATGRIGRPGMGPFSLTGQPNAMGGREVGGLANQLAAHMVFTPEAIDRVGRYWRAPRMATREGLKAVALFEAIAERRIRALWVMGTNPAVSLPEADRQRKALAQLDFLAISDNVLASDTLACQPHVALPALGWGEKDGTVTNSERRISRQRPFLPPPGEARRLGFAGAFGWDGPAAVFREHAGLSAFENDGTRDFDLGALATVDTAAYDALAPVQWPVRAGETTGETRFFAEGGFFTPDRRARFVAPEAPALAQPASPAFPLVLLTGRTRDQWHTMTRTGLSPRLGGHAPAPFVAMNPADAARRGIGAGDLVRLSSPHGAATLLAQLSADQPPGTLFAPIHWSDTTASGARVNALIGAEVDPVSGQPESKGAPVRAERVDAATRGILLVRGAAPVRDAAPWSAAWWADVAVAGGHARLFADARDATAWRQALWREEAWRQAGASGTAVEHDDGPAGLYRAARFDADGRVAAALFIGPAVAPPRLDAVKHLLEQANVAPEARRALLRGVDAAGSPGPQVCACFGVGRHALERLVAAEPGVDLATLGERLKAGTACGSCRPELCRLLRPAAAAP
ncbi:molybdopterin-dependent oxidoreductase [Ancylobacter lacus]|uniref:molybdopterin-dependent oxidoreductase n=1 Tax=Ancylobacter lacus TaxID=2579970 RepID=UPI001BD1B53F|nr:molybdopterin-dependent oxidoreductase [Ancylobacter lacus]MBS7540720.1 molybdopterin-dependent oxidoreductase [Ancylobacter lacus]